MTATRSRRPSRRSSGRSDSSDKFAQRRHEIRRRQGARRLRWVAGFALLALLAVAVIGFLNSDAMSVDVVTVNGVERDRAEQVYRATQVEAGQPLIDVDGDEVASRVEQLPWVRAAAVARSWNGTVVIDVESRQTLFALAGTVEGEYVGVDSDGVQIERLGSDQVADSVVRTQASSGADTAGSVIAPVLHGVTVDIQPGQSAPPAAALAINFLLSAPEDVRQMVGSMEAVDGELSLRLKSGSVAKLGDSRQLGAKYQSLETVLAQVDLACLAAVDVSVPSAPSVTRSCQTGDEVGQDG